VSRLLLVAGAAGVAVVLLALAGCASSAERSAEIAARGNHLIADRGDLKIVPATDVKIGKTAVVRGDGGAAAVVEITNRSAKTKVDVPVLIDVRDRKGAEVYTNAGVGLQRSLQRIATLRPKQTVWWVNDQLLGAEETAHRVKAKVGRSAVTTAAPKVRLTHVHWDDDSAGPYLTGTVVNPGRTLLRDVPIFAVARQHGTIVAAGRALVPKLPPGGATAKPVKFRIVFLGKDPRHADIALTAAATVPAPASKESSS